MLISKFDNSTTEHHIKDYETRYMFVFPAQYRSFLLKYNGGNTPSTRFKIGKISSDLKGFYGFGNADKSLNYDVFDNMDRINEFVEDNIIPIGTNIFGDYILIGIGDNNSGRVYFIYHDRPKKYIELASDFRNFVGKCKSEKIGYIRTIEERKAALIANGKGDKITPIKIAGWQAEIDAYKDMQQEEVIF